MEITTEENRISIDGVSYPKGGFYVKPIPKGVALVDMSKSWSIKILVDDTTIDGSPVADRDELITFFNEQGFKSGGSGPGTEVSWDDITDKPTVIASGATQAAARTSLGLGSAATSSVSAFATAAQGALASSSVQSVTGDGVDNTDPMNPVVNLPTWSTITGRPEFVAEGVTATAARTAIGAGTSNLAIGTTAATAMAGNTPIPAPSTWANIEGKPAFVAEGATAGAARTALGLGTAATTSANAYATSEQGNTADTALQPGYLESISGYDAGEVQTLKNNSGVLEWVTD